MGFAFIIIPSLIYKVCVHLLWLYQDKVHVLDFVRYTILVLDWTFSFPSEVLKLWKGA